MCPLFVHSEGQERSAPDRVTTSIPYVIEHDRQFRYDLELKEVDPQVAASLDLSVRFVLAHYLQGHDAETLESAVVQYRCFGKVLLPDGRIIRDIAYG